MTRVAFFIDGFNLYHSLKDNAPECRWLNLRKMCEHYINPKEETIVAIYYFSAIATWHPDITKAQKHTQYIERLRKENVQFLGSSKKKIFIAKFVENHSNHTKKNEQM